MIIDIHTHIFPDKIAYDTLRHMEQMIYKCQGIKVDAEATALRSDLSKTSIEAGIDKSIICPVATNITQPEKLNALASKINETTDETHLFSFGAIHPDNENYKEIIDDVVARDLKGIKLHPDYQDTLFSDIKYQRIVDYAAQKDLVIVIHAGEDIGIPAQIHCTPDMILDMHKHMQPEKLVLAHMGGWRMWDEVEEKLVGLPYYMDSAICLNRNVKIHMENDQFVRMVRNHGADKVLFGTDSPWYDQARAIEDIRSTGLTSDELDLVLGDNANHLIFGQ